MFYLSSKDCSDGLGLGGLSSQRLSSCLPGQSRASLSEAVLIAERAAAGYYYYSMLQPLSAAWPQAGGPTPRRPSTRSNVTVGATQRTASRSTTSPQGGGVGSTAGLPKKRRPQWLAQVTQIGDLASAFDSAVGAEWTGSRALCKPGLATRHGESKIPAAAVTVGRGGRPAGPWAHCS